MPTWYTYHMQCTLRHSAQLRSPTWISQSTKTCFTPQVCSEVKGAYGPMCYMFWLDWMVSFVRIWTRTLRGSSTCPLLASLCCFKDARNTSLSTKAVGRIGQNWQSKMMRLLWTSTKRRNRKARDCMAVGSKWLSTLSHGFLCRDVWNSLSAWCGGKQGEICSRCKH